MIVSPGHTAIASLGDPRYALPEGLTAATAIIWGAAITAHPAEWHPGLAWRALGEFGTQRMANVLFNILDQRQRLLAHDGLSAWQASPRAPAMVWWPTKGVLAMQAQLVARIRADGGRLGVYLHPYCLVEQ